MTTPNKDESPPNFQAQVKMWDDPRNAADLLSREAFAERIASALGNWKKEESLVVALFGDWGAGKTWLLHRIKAQLEKDQKFTVCDFNPWQFESNEQIASELFTSIFDILPKEGTPSHQARARLWATLGAMVSVAKIGTTVASVANPAIAAASPVLGGIRQLMQQGEIAAQSADSSSAGNTITETRESLIELFREEDAPKILVTIDDLDRLPDEQIQMIFRLLKTTVNFPNLHFLLLGERHQLAKALDPIAHDEGDRYMEKIVQVPVYLPEIDGVFLKTRLKEGLTTIAASYDYLIIPEGKAERSDELWNDFLKIRLTNLRVIYRLLTVVEFKCSALSHQGKLEVDLLDLLSIEYLRLYAPTTYNKVLEEIHDLTYGFRLPVSSSNSAKEDNRNAVNILDGSELGEAGAYQACAHLFPKFPDAVPQWSSKHLSHSQRKAKVALVSSERPICDPNYQPLYFKLSLDEKILSRSSYDTVLNESSQAKLEAQLLAIPSDTRWLLFQHMLAESTFAKKIQTFEGWLFALANISDTLDDSSRLFVRSECSYAYKVWLELFSEIPDETPQTSLIESLFEKTDSVTLPALLLEDLRDAAGIRFSNHKVEKNDALPLLNKQQLNCLSDKLLKNALSACKNKSYPWTRESAHRLYRLLYAIGPERFAKILEDTEATEFTDAMAILEAVAIAMIPRFHSNFFSPESIESGLSQPYFVELKKFASGDYWKKLSDLIPPEFTLTDEQSIILEHIRRGQEDVEEAEPSNP